MRCAAAIGFLQMKRWGQIKGDVDYRKVASEVFLATDAARLMKEAGLTPPETASKGFEVMGKPFDPADNYKITYYAPQPRAAVEVVDFDDYTKLVDYGATGRVKLYTLTDELFIPGFMERDEGEREEPIEKFPWDGVSGTRPFHELLKTTTVGVY